MQGCKTLPEEWLALLGLEACDGSLQFLRASQNEVYSFQDGQGRRRILRLTDGDHRSRSEIQEELEWMQDLTEHGVRVCPPVPWGNGEMVQTLPHPRLRGEVCHAVVFVKAEGRALVRDDLGGELARAHGELLGRLHLVARREPDRWLTGRKRWHEERYFNGDLTRYVPDPWQAMLRNCFHQMRRRLEEDAAQCQELTVYGPVHLDLGYANMHRHGSGALIAFDFDNATQAPLVADVAAALYGAIFTGLRCAHAGDRGAFAMPRTGAALQEMWEPFRAGYESQCPWPVAWSMGLPLWLEVLYLRSVVHAFRMQHAVMDETRLALLAEDVENLVNSTPPLVFGCR